MHKNKIKIILGSASVGRRKILKNMGYDFEIMPADIDEKAISSDDPEKLTLMLARAKADALLPKINPALYSQRRIRFVLSLFYKIFIQLQRFLFFCFKKEKQNKDIFEKGGVKEPALLITSDQVGFCNGRMVGKPENEAQAREYLGGYANYPAKTITAVVITNTKTGKPAYRTGRRVEGTDVAEVFFHPIPEEAINQSIEKGDIFNQSGAFSIDDEILGKYVKEIKGEPESVIGLPKKLTRKLLNEMIEKW